MEKSLLRLMLKVSFIKSGFIDAVLKAGKKIISCRHDSKSQKTVIIIGGGPGGLITAESLRQVSMLLT
jgi:threonine dehydrogenase-like Zn-dependent dehydrogenase